MRRARLGLALVLLCVSLPSLANGRLHRNKRQLTNLNLEKLAHGFVQILHEDLSAPFNGEWGYVYKAEMLAPTQNLSSEQRIRKTAYHALCKKLKECPTAIDVQGIDNKDVDTMVNYAGNFLFEFEEQTNRCDEAYLELRKKTLSKLRHLFATTVLFVPTAQIFVGYQQSPYREGGFTAFLDPMTDELLILGSNDRP